MARPPQAPPPGAGGAYPPTPGQLPPYPGGSFDGGRQSPPPYPPGQAPIPPRRPRRRSPVIAPALAFVGLLLLAGVSVWAVSFLDGILGEASSSEPTTDTAVVAELDRTPEPGASEPSGLDPSDPPDGVEIETPEPGPVGPTAPPIVVEPPTADRADVPGTLLFARLGDIYAASGTELRRLTNSDSVRSDSSPVWSPDGKQIYFIRTTKTELRTAALATRASTRSIPPT